MWVHVAAILVLAVAVALWFVLLRHRIEKLRGDKGCGCGMSPLGTCDRRCDGGDGRPTSDPDTL